MKLFHDNCTFNLQSKLIMLTWAYFQVGLLSDGFLFTKLLSLFLGGLIFGKLQFACLYVKRYFILINATPSVITFKLHKIDLLQFHFRTFYIHKEVFHSINVLMPPPQLQLFRLHNKFGTTQRVKIR